MYPCYPNYPLGNSSTVYRNPDYCYTGNACFKPNDGYSVNYNYNVYTNGSQQATPGPANQGVSLFTLAHFWTMNSNNQVCRERGNNNTYARMREHTHSLALKLTHTLTYPRTLQITHYYFELHITLNYTHLKLHILKIILSLTFSSRLWPSFTPKGILPSDWTCWRFKLGVSTQRRKWCLHCLAYRDLRERRRGKRMLRWRRWRRWRRLPSLSWRTIEGVALLSAVRYRLNLNCNYF